MSELSLGILVDSTTKQQYLDNLAVQAGHRIGYSCVLGANTPLPDVDQAVDVWVLDLSEFDEIHLPEPQQSALLALLDKLVQQTAVPVILNDGADFHRGSSEQQEWVRRTLLRLERLTGDVNLQYAELAQEVWILAASTGGPAAVKDFMQSLPANLNVAFLYVQHIDGGQASALAKMMSNAGHYPAQVAEQGTVLMNNTLTVITAGRTVSVHDNGTLLIGKDQWSGIYAPSIDQVAANVARVYRQHCSVIIFTGMGHDGAASCRFVKQQGGNVWAQSPTTCAIPSMPESAIDTKTVTNTGSPEELAAALVKLKAAERRALKRFF